MKPEPLFYIQRVENEEAGPYDLVQMAGMLRKRIITADTPTRLEGEGHWQPFSWRGEFVAAREMSPDAVSMRAAAQDEKNAPPIPLPSAETIVRIVGSVLLLLVLAVVTFILAHFSSSLGICLTVIGVALALVGTCLMYVRLADEDHMTILMVFFVPGYDIYYFLANFWEYLPYFLMRYVGGILAAAGLAGMASSNASGAHDIQSMLRLYGL